MSAQFLIGVGGVVPPRFIPIHAIRSSLHTTLILDRLVHDSRT